MNTFFKKSLLFLLCVMCCGFVFSTALCKEKKHETIPITSSIGKNSKESASCGKKEFDQLEMIEQFLLSDERGNEKDPAYALLYMDMDKVDKKTNLVYLLKETDGYKGSGTVLYCSDNYILVLTAWHNLYKEVSDVHDIRASGVKLVVDNKDRKKKNIVLASMVGSNYVQVAGKDIALVAMKLNNVDIFENNKAVFDILDLRKAIPEGKNNAKNAVINQYPDMLDFYIKICGLAYHENGHGHHYVPTLPGSSGSAVIIDGKVAGVHTSSGRELPKGEVNIKYADVERILVEDNFFELISFDEIRRENIGIRKSVDKAILFDLINKYLATLNKVKNNHKEEHEEL